MKSKLSNLINSSQNGDKNSILEIIIKFTPLIKKYSRKLKYDGSDTDLIIQLIETINKFPLFKKPYLENESYIVSYIHNSIKHEYIHLSKKYQRLYNMEATLNLEILKDATINYTSAIEDKIILAKLLDKLSKTQKKIIMGIFLKDYSVTQLGQKFGISRQSVNKTKNIALKKLRNELNDDKLWKMKY
ncbi:sigma-70 family RNA polymerase sigma factor [Clostridium sp. JS66]|uniref:sigma-70 family RNA polymerase sigma factor n=1 Tax=Clostridium sp. JS66 TaxID=3064705 RepID=UPI00298EC045|nr:sigma-70 family RNA polymerase sigma factor [Clostridium sp. JS66]WPC42333.1 sigma-70 family RNA polymerase sigma factor [Clostridium sp. JS66]